MGVSNTFDLKEGGMAKQPASASITLGYFFDGGAFPGPLQGLEAQDGAVATGPLGLLSLLETWLGLPPSADPGGERIAHCLKAALKLSGTEPEPFYARSLESAPWACAQRLLEMRSQLALAGWQGEKPESGQFRLARLEDLARLEAALEPAWDLPARVNRVIAELARWPLPHALHLELLEPAGAWPQPWRRLLAALQKAGAVFSGWRMPVLPKRPTVLARLQEALRHPERPARADAGDGSLVLLTADSADEAAEACAQLLARAGEDADGGAVLLRATPDLALEEALARYHLPASGYAPASRWRSILQILPVCLRMRWAPRSMQSLLDFLLLPEAPVPAAVRHRMASALEEFPGIGSEAWEESLAKAKAWVADAFGEKAEGLWQGYLAWLVPAASDPKEGMPLEDVLAACGDIEEWAQAKGGQRAGKGEDAPLLRVLAAQAREFAGMARAAGLARFTRPVLESMLDHECALGAEHVFTQEEAAPWAVASHPGQLHGPCGTLVWWQFRGQAQPASQLWSEDELAWLASKGVQPSGREELHRLEGLAWTRAASLARKRLVLVLPARKAGEALPLHPFWDHIAVSFRDAGGKALSAGRAEALFARTARDLGKVLAQDQGIPLAPVEALAVPEEPEAPLHLPPQPAPGQISFTAASEAVECPFRGLVKQRLHPGGPPQAALPELRQILGSFSHYLVQRLLEQGVPASSEEAAQSMRKLAERHLESHAAPLLEPACTLDRGAFVESMERVGATLAGMLGAGGFAHPQAEHDLERSLNGRQTRLIGRCDVHLDSIAGPVVWDMKWSYGKKKYARMLDEGTARQLAAYCWMDGRARDAAYWLLPIDELLGTPGSGASGGNVHAADLEAVWEAMAAALERTFSEWEEGAAAIAQRDAKGRPRKESGCAWCELAPVCGRIFHEEV